jgi:hypothetical protein
VTDFVKAHWQQIGAVSLITAAFVSSYFPALRDMHDYFVSLGFALGVYGTAFVPSFAQNKEPSK